MVSNVMIFRTMNQLLQKEVVVLKEEVSKTPCAYCKNTFICKLGSEKQVSCLTYIADEPVYFGSDKPFKLKTEASLFEPRKNIVIVTNKFVFCFGHLK